jgi:hypothetical protein
LLGHRGGAPTPRHPAPPRHLTSAEQSPKPERPSGLGFDFCKLNFDKIVISRDHIPSWKVLTGSVVSRRRLSKI